jgi:hypothetical protein
MAHRSSGGEYPIDMKPRWDDIDKTLLWGKPIRTYKRGPAFNQTTLLKAFEAAGWVRRIPDPFEDQEKLNQTVKDLKLGLPRGTITFSADGNGGVRWDPAPQS